MKIQPKFKIGDAVRFKDDFEYYNAKSDITTRITSLSNYIIINVIVSKYEPLYILGTKDIKNGQARIAFRGMMLPESALMYGRAPLDPDTVRYIKNWLGRIASDDGYLDISIVEKKLINLLGKLANDAYSLPEEYQ